MYQRVLNDLIKSERRGDDFLYSTADKKVLKKMFKAVNARCATNLKYLAEIWSLDIRGAGAIMADYADEFESEEIRACIVTQMAADNIENCDRRVYNLYLHFKNSEDYAPASAHIYTRYDNAFQRLKPKGMQEALLSLFQNPSDAYCLPLTVKLLASWQTEGFEVVLLSFLDDEKTAVQLADFGGSDSEAVHRETARQLKMTAISALRYYPSAENRKMIEKYIHHLDKDIALTASKAYAVMKKE